MLAPGDPLPDFIDADTKIAIAEDLNGVLSALSIAGPGWNSYGDDERKWNLTSVRDAITRLASAIAKLSGLEEKDLGRGYGDSFVVPDEKSDTKSSRLDEFQCQECRSWIPTYLDGSEADVCHMSWCSSAVHEQQDESQVESHIAKMWKALDEKQTTRPKKKRPKREPKK